MNTGLTLVYLRLKKVKMHFYQKNGFNFGQILFTF